MVYLILVVYRLLLLGVLILGGPWWLWRMAASGRYRAGIAGRLGFVPSGLRDVTSGSRDQESGISRRGWVWLHAVSVGEVLAACGIVQQLVGAGFGVAISTTTEAGQTLARERFAGSPVFYMPLDFAWLIGRYLQVIRPRLVVTMESELWPNLIHTCRVRGTPLVVVNARVSDRSFPRYMRLRGVWGPLLRQVSMFLAQGEEAAERLRAIGVAGNRVSVTGNLKYDVGEAVETGMTRRVRSLLGGLRLVVAGSTLPGEEEALLASFAEVLRWVPDTALLLAPRHKDRFASVQGLVERSGCPLLRCSRLTGAEESILPGTVLLLDTIGDLASMYGVGSLAFLGGSLVAKGGHNPLEAARFGVPVVMGESYFNFREMVVAMRAEDAVRTVRPEELAETFVKMLGESGRAMGERGRTVFDSQTGATERTIAGLMALLEGER